MKILSNFKMTSLVLLVFHVLAAQSQNESRPVVLKADLPSYPLAAVHARIEGIASLKITTDGKQIIAVDGIGGPAMLVNAAKEHVQTWKLLVHKPTTFITKFDM